MVVDEVMDAISVYGRRSLRIVTRLVDMHLELASGNCRWNSVESSVHR
ncbi:MAG: hypothetical protein IGR76_00985 [Synechococcales cyanobacterium T60_A2020_003]|nr:hypothetical protein [Synechococcales cyanobacterium T60_A2020_003]